MSFVVCLCAEAEEKYGSR